MPHSVRQPTSVFAVTLALFALLIASPTQATQIAEWNFDDGTANDSVGSYDMSIVGGGPGIGGGIASFDGDEGSPSFLETSGYGGNPEWTLGMRIRAGTPVDQGAYQGIFSNNSSSSANFSWQVENFGGRYQFRSTSGVWDIGAPTGGFDTIVIRKTGGNDGDIWLNGVLVVASFGTNPGGLQNFRIGTNRNTSAFYAFDADWFRVYDTYEDPAMVPEPSSAVLFGLGLMGLARSRRRRA